MKEETQNIDAMVNYKDIQLFILLLLFSCRNEQERKDDLEFDIKEIAIDYHSITYDTLKNSDRIYDPENVILFITVSNLKDRLINLPLHSKSNQDDTLSSFFSIVNNDTIYLEPVKGRLIIGPKEKVDLAVEVPFDSYGNFKMAFREIINGNLGNDFYTMPIVFKKRTGRSFTFKNVSGDRSIHLTCSDTSLVIDKVLANEVK